MENSLEMCDERAVASVVSDFARYGLQAPVFLSTDSQARILSKAISFWAAIFLDLEIKPMVLGSPALNAWSSQKEKMYSPQLRKIMIEKDQEKKTETRQKVKSQ